MNACTWIGHKWPKWSDPVDATRTFVDYVTKERTSLKTKVQERACDRCNLTQYRLIKPEGMDS